MGRGVRETAGGAIALRGQQVAAPAADAHGLDMNLVVPSSLDQAAAAVAHVYSRDREEAIDDLVALGVPRERAEAKTLTEAESTLGWRERLSTGPADWTAPLGERSWLWGGEPELVARTRDAAVHNQGSSLHRLAQSVHGQDAVIIAAGAPPENYAVREHGVTFISADSLRDLPASAPAKRHMMVCADMGAAGIIRHEYGHTVWSRMLPASKQRLSDLLIEQRPDGLGEISLYAAQDLRDAMVELRRSGAQIDRLRASMEAACEVYTVVADPDYDALLWPQWVEEARGIIEQDLRDREITRRPEGGSPLATAAAATDDSEAV